MADNITIDTITGSPVAATDDVAGIHYQRVKLDIGGDGVSSPVVAGNPLPVSGTVDLGATDNAVLDAIAASVAGTLTVGSHAVTNAGTFAVQAAQSGTWNVTNVSGTVSLPTGAATAAKQPALGTAGTASADVLSVQGIASMTPITVDGTVAVTNAGITTIAGAVSGTEMQVDVLTMPTVTVNSHAVTNAGTFAVQAAQSGTWSVDLGATDNAVLDTIATPVATIGTTPLQRVAIFDASNTQITSFGGGTQYTEDAAAAANPVGTASILVRADTPAGAVSADGDNVAQRGTNYGAAYVQVVTSSGAFIDSFGGSGGTAIADGATFTRNTTQVTPAGAVVETSAPTLTNGDVAGLSQTTSGSLRVAVAEGGVAGVVEDAAAAGGEEGVMVLAVRRDTPASGVSADGDFAALSVDSTGKLHVNVGNTVTVGSHAVTNAGTFATQVDGAALTALQVIDNPVIVDDAAFTPATTSVTMAGFFADEASTDSVNEGDGGAARMTLDRKVIVTPYVHAAAGGWTPYKNLDCDESEDEIKATAGKLGWIHVINRSTGVRYIKFYNATAASVTVGTTTPVLSFPIPTMADTNGAGFNISFGDAGVQFDTAITVAATTGVADNDTGAPAANDVVLNAGYL